MNVKIAPSIMCADFRNLQRDINELEKGGADLFHFDVMDGQFVPNFTLGPDIINTIRKISSVPFDVHLMISEPIRYIETFKEAGADIISVHIEACSQIIRTINKIKECGIRPSVALNPTTSLNNLEYVLDKVDMILIMSVEPGFAGQTFIEDTFSKIRNLKEMIRAKQLNVEIEVDGNINKNNAPELVKEGATILIGGTSSIFKEGKDIKIGIRELKESILSG